MRRQIVVAAVAVFLFTLRSSQTQADINEWAWVNPNDPTQGVAQSSVVCPGGSGVFAVPSANLRHLDLTQAYLIGANLTNASLDWATLTNANLSNANLADAVVTGADFSSTTSQGFTAQQLYSTASYKAKNLSGIGLAGNEMTRWNFKRQNLTSANFTGATLYSAVLTGAKLSSATLTGADLSSAILTNADLSNATLTSRTENATLVNANLAHAVLTAPTLVTPASAMPVWRERRWPGPISPVLPAGASGPNSFTPPPVT